MLIIISENINEIALAPNILEMVFYEIRKKSFIMADFGLSKIKLGRGYHKKFHPHHSIIDSRLSPSRDELVLKQSLERLILNFPLGN